MNFTEMLNLKKFDILAQVDLLQNQSFQITHHEIAQAIGYSV